MSGSYWAGGARTFAPIARDKLDSDFYYGSRRTWHGLCGIEGKNGVDAVSISITDFGYISQAVQDHDQLIEYVSADYYLIDPLAADDLNRHYQLAQL